jgi:NAD(P)-dependent dehydrogenase (short-subunit alcohol dehydrogenase family)
VVIIGGTSGIGFASAKAAVAAGAAVVIASSNADPGSQ